MRPLASEFPHALGSPPPQSFAELTGDTSECNVGEGSCLWQEQ